MKQKQSRIVLVLIALFAVAGFVRAQSAGWRPASERELASLLPARAQVVSEHIETEMRSASGVTDGKGKFIAGVVLITAGYSADGKYSHYFVTQVPLEIGQGTRLAPGEYVLGWQRDTDALHVHFYDAATGAPRGDAEARRIPGDTRVEAFRIWPYPGKAVVQIGRFGMPYQVVK